MIEAKKKFLQGAQEIKTAFGFSHKVFIVLLKLGLPVTRINRRIYGYFDNIDDWLRANIKDGDYTIDESGIDSEIDSD